MKIAITGGTGFVGRSLAQALVAEGHTVVLIARNPLRPPPLPNVAPFIHCVTADIADREALAAAFVDCGSVVHCAGISREWGPQTFAHVHAAGTAAVVDAARDAGLRQIVLLSFLRARPDCGLLYHESKWEAEELVRNSGLDFTVLKAGVIFGAGDQMLSQLQRAVSWLPVFPTVGLREQPLRPVAVEDVVRVLVAAVFDPRLSRLTVSVTGPEALFLSDIVRRVARVQQRRLRVIPCPGPVHLAVAFVLERLLRRPIVTFAQTWMLWEGLNEPFPRCEQLPQDLAPAIRPSEARFRELLAT